MDREQMALDGIPVGTRWRHFKGSTYRVLDNALSSTDSTPLVIYQSDETGQKWARSRREFLGFHHDGVLRFEQFE